MCGLFAQVAWFCAHVHPTADAEAQILMFRHLAEPVHMPEHSWVNLLQTLLCAHNWTLASNMLPFPWAANSANLLNLELLTSLIANSGQSLPSRLRPILSFVRAELERRDRDARQTGSFARLLNRPSERGTLPLVSCGVHRHDSAACLLLLPNPWGPDAGRHPLLLAALNGDVLTMVVLAGAMEARDVARLGPGLLAAVLGNAEGFTLPELCNALNLLARWALSCGY